MPYCPSCYVLLHTLYLKSDHPIPWSNKLTNQSPGFFPLRGAGRRRAWPPTAGCNVKILIPFHDQTNQPINHLGVLLLGGGAELRQAYKTTNQSPGRSPLGGQSGGRHGHPLLDVNQVGIHGGPLEHAVDEGAFQALILFLKIIGTEKRLVSSFMQHTIQNSFPKVPSRTVPTKKVAERRPQNKSKIKRPCYPPRPQF